MRSTIVALFLAIPLISHATHVRCIVEDNSLFSCNRENCSSSRTFTSGREYWLNEEARVVLQKSISAPHSIMAGNERLHVQPYAYWRGIEIGKQILTGQKSIWSNYLALGLGTLGICSHTDGSALRQLEEQIHTQDIGAIEARLRREFCANAQWWTKCNIGISQFASIVPRCGALVGTLQDAAEVGCTAKIGWNVSRYKDAASGNSMLSIGRRKPAFLESLVLCGFADCSGRCYLYSHSSQKPIFTDVSTGSRPIVGQARFGIHAEAYGIFIVWYGALRARTYEQQDSRLSFGGLNVGHRWNF